MQERELIEAAQVAAILICAGAIVALAEGVVRGIGSITGINMLRGDHDQ